MSLTSILQGAVSDLDVQEYTVNLIVDLSGSSGTYRLDYRTDKSVLKSVGHRAVIYLKQQPTLQLITVPTAEISYSLWAVHYNRASSSRPSDVGSIAAIPGCVEIRRSQLLDVGRITLGHTPPVTLLVKPDPAVGYSPCLDIAWTSIGTKDTTKFTVVVSCVFLASGADLPAYV